MLGTVRSKLLLYVINCQIRNLLGILNKHYSFMGVTDYLAQAVWCFQYLVLKTDLKEKVSKSCILL